MHFWSGAYASNKAEISRSCLSEQCNHSGIPEGEQDWESKKLRVQSLWIVLTSIGGYNACKTLSDMGLQVAGQQRVSSARIEY